MPLPPYSVITVLFIHPVNTGSRAARLNPGYTHTRARSGGRQAGRQAHTVEEALLIRTPASLVLLSLSRVVPFIHYESRVYTPRDELAFSLSPSSRRL